MYTTLDTLDLYMTLEMLRHSRRVYDTRDIYAYT